MATLLRNQTSQIEYTTGYRPLSFLQRILLWLYVFSFCFDFKGDAGGSFIQFIYAGISITCVMTLFLIGKIRQPSKDLRQIGAYWWLYLFSTFLVVAIGTMTYTLDVTLDFYIRVLLPFLFCGLSLVVCQLLQSRGGHPSELILPLITCGLVSTAWRTFYALQVSGVSMEEMRYQLLSPATPLLFAFGMMGVLLFEKVRSLALIALAASTVSIVLSITRSFIFTAVMCLVSILWFQHKQGNALNLRFFARRLLRVTLAIVVLSIVLGIVTLVRPSFASDWTTRMFNNAGGYTSQDVTYLIRMAEVSGDWNAVKHNPMYLLFGKGMGAAYYHDPSYSREISKAMKFDDQPAWFPADCTWSYTLFSSGIVFGSMVLGFFILGIRKSYLTACSPVAVGGEDQSLSRETAIFAFLSLLSYFSVTFTGAPFGERLSGLILGLLVGMAYWTPASMLTFRRNHR